MINEARTLLMHVVGVAHPYDIPGEELLPEGYSPPVLTAAIESARSIIFGAKPDRYMLNYRCRQIMGLLHATELEQFVRELDSRITYDTRKDAFSNNNLFKLSIDRVDGATTTPLVFGEPVAPDKSGQMLYAWLVSVLNSTTAVTTLSQPYLSAQPTFTMTNGLSSSISLPGQNVSVQLHENTTGAGWRITKLTRPTSGLGQIQARLRSLSESNVVSIFQLDNPTGAAEPYKTFYNLWKSHPALPYSLGGFMLAMIYSTKKLLK